MRAYPRPLHRQATLISALNVWALSVRGCELFHADVHAGNLLVLEDRHRDPEAVPQPPGMQWISRRNMSCPWLLVR